jgi:hypothetical protein
MCVFISFLRDLAVKKIIHVYFLFSVYVNLKTCVHILNYFINLFSPSHTLDCRNADAGSVLYLKRGLGVSECSSACGIGLATDA